MGPPSEWPTRTYGPRSPEAWSSAWRSAAAPAGVIGWGTAVDAATSHPAGPFVAVPGLSYAHTRLNVATSGKTPVWSGRSVALQFSPRSPPPATSTTVGLPRPRHSMYI